MPFGMVSACAYSGAYVSGYGQYDVSLTGEPPQLYFDRHEALGIAHFQQSGTGRIRSYYNYLLTTPLVGDGLEGVGKRYGLINESAKAGYYSGEFEESAVKFEVACTERAAVHRYHFPSNKTGKVAIDLSNGGLRIEGMEVYPNKANMEFLSPSECWGSVRFEGVTVYFRIQVVTPIADSGYWKNDGQKVANRIEYSLKKKVRKSEERFGLWFEAQDPGQPLELHIGFSTRNLDRPAKALADVAELGFDGVIEQATERWDSVLDKIEIEGASPEQQQQFYTALYHATLKPANFYDENPFTKKAGPFFFDLSTLWDLYKTQLPLAMTLWPEWGKDFVEFLVEVAQREGAFPVSYLMNNLPECFAKQATGLCHMILTDAKNRGIEGDWESVLNLLHKTSLGSLGRGGKFEEYANHSIVQPLSHTLDIAFANYCIAQLAKIEGNELIYREAIALADHWRNAFAPNTGLLKEESDYYEGENWNYSFRFIHDMVGRIKLAGGEDQFVALLDKFFGFTAPTEDEIVHPFEGLNNEPDMEAPYTYLFAGRHDRTAEVIHHVMTYQFTTGRGGLPGNEDSGGLSSWYVWSAMGVFPVTGLPFMLIGTPLYPKSVIKMRGGDFTIIAHNHGADRIYVKSALLNGSPLDRCYLKISEFSAEAILELKMSDTPSEWAKDTRPPSFIS